MTPEPSTIYRIIEQLLPTEEALSARDLVGKVLPQLEEKHPDLLAAWSQRLIEDALASVVRAIIHNRRAEDRTQAIRVAFGQKLDPDYVPGTYFDLERFSVLVEGKRVYKTLGDMTAGDHRYVAAQYAKSAHKDGMLAAFHLAVAKRVEESKRDSTREALSEQEYIRLLGSILGEEVEGIGVSV